MSYNVTKIAQYGLRPYYESIHSPRSEALLVLYLTAEDGQLRSTPAETKQPRRGLDYPSTHIPLACGKLDALAGKPHPRTRQVPSVLLLSMLGLPFSPLHATDAIDSRTVHSPIHVPFQHGHVEQSTYQHITFTNYHRSPRTL